MTLLAELNAILAAGLPAQDNARTLAGVLYSRCYTSSILDAPPASQTTGVAPATLGGEEQACTEFASACGCHSSKD